VTIQNSSISLSLYRLYQIRISKSTFGSKIFYILAIFFLFFLDFVSQFSHAETEADRRRTLACKRLSVACMAERIHAYCHGIFDKAAASATSVTSGCI